MAHKYGAIRCDRLYPDCGRHASLREHRRWQELALLERAGEIRNLREQVPFELVPSVVLNGRKRPPIRFVADFVFEEPRQVPMTNEPCLLWTQVIEDAKGVATREFRLKAHLMKAKYGMEVRLA